MPCVVLAGVNILLPELALSLNNEDNRLWADIVRLAALVDLFVTQPLLVLLSVLQWILRFYSLPIAPSQFAALGIM